MANSPRMSEAVAKNTLYLTAASVGQKALAFVYFLLLARVMKPEGTGAYFLALALTGLFSVVTDFGVTSVLIRDVAKDPSQAIRMLRQGMGLKIPLCAIAVICVIIASWVFGYDANVRALALLACLVMIADAFTLLFYGILRGFHLLKYESVGIFIGQLITLCLGGAVLLFFPSLSILVLVLLCGSVFNMIFSATRVAKRVGWRAFVPQFDAGAKRLFFTAVPFALAGIFTKIYSSADAMLLGFFSGTAAVGVYSIAYKFTYAFQFLPLAFVAALYPGMSAAAGNSADRSDADHARITELLNEGFWYLSLLVAPIVFGLWAIAPDAVLLAGLEYNEAVPVLKVLIFALIPLFWDFPIGSLLNAVGMQKIKTAIVFATMILNIVMNIVLIPVFGSMGAAVSALASFSFLFLAGFWQVRKAIPGYAYRDFFFRVFPIMLSGFVMGIFAMFVRPFVGFFMSVLLAAFAYVGMAVITGAFRNEHLRKALRLLKQEKPYAGDSSFDA